MSGPKVVWTPLPGSQTLALSCPCDEILYEGTRGPGKTDAQLMRFRSRVGIGYGIFWRGVIIDVEYKNLDDLISKSERWFNQFDDGAKFLRSKGDYRWVWPTGEELLFRAAKEPKDYWQFHGQEFPFIGWNELTKQPTPKLYNDMMSCNRTSFVPERDSPDGKRLPPIPLEIFSTTNPYGTGHNWVKRQFIDPAPAGTVVTRVVDVFNPQTQQREKIKRHQVRIFGSYKENRYLTPEYIASLERITDRNKRRAWLWGDWDIVAGGALDDVWSDRMVLPRFSIPKSWRVDRSFDWGSTAPFSAGWWAESDGTEAELPNGKTFCPPPGSLIRIAEWYGATDIGLNEGLKLSAKQIAQGIKSREAELLAAGLIQEKPRPGPADNQIRDTVRSDIDTIEEEMAKEGVRWLKSNKSPGSRINGLELIRMRMTEAGKDHPEAPGLWIMENCRAALATLPTLPRDEENPDDVDSDAEDHIYDEVRYRVLHSKRDAMGINLKSAV